MLSYDGSRPRRSLVAVFVAWKALLLLVAVGSAIGPAYDTSTTLLSPQASNFDESALDLGTRLTRWDAIYFIENARRGYLFEQEWAFGAGLPTLIATAVQGLAWLGVESDGSLESQVGIAIAHGSHLLSVLALYQLVLKIGKQPRPAFIAALLHVLSPAGLFLSAPYQESTCAFLSFLGLWLLAHGCLEGQPRTARGDVATVGSGIVFGLSTLFRSNGVLNGVPIAALFLAEAASLAKSGRFSSLRRLTALGLAGIATATGFLGPQAIAYQRFCSEPSGELRPWCAKLIPGVYTFVQEHYWYVWRSSLRHGQVLIIGRNVGLFRYWTPGNIPLFLLAAPMIYLMARSGVDMLLAGEPESSKTPRSPDVSVLIGAMAVAQLVLTGLAITTYHIQIITRIGSGYAIWHWWLAVKLQDKQDPRFGSRVVVFMVMYATIQGALFASFLPPA